MGVYGWLLVFVIFVIAGLLWSKQAQARRRRREEAWFAATLKTQPPISGTSGGRNSLRRRPALLDSVEARFLGALTQAFPKMAVLGQVGLTRLLVLYDDISEHAELASLTADYVVCKPDVAGFLPTIVIELDNPKRTDDQQKRARDHKRRALEEAGFPYLLYAADALPTQDTLRRDVASAIVALTHAAKAAPKKK